MADDRQICGSCKWCWKEDGIWHCRNRYSNMYDNAVSYEERCDRHSFRDKSYTTGIEISIPGKRNVPRI
ncbi:MAG: hypothetical protein IJH64_07300 [Oscillospiraceae bacterium]|nr:hypothetical protein [Oscillospiraceae bacterium]